MTPLSPFACPGPGNGNATGAQRVGQTFVANGTGAIGSASFLLNGVSPDIGFVVEIRATQAGVPTATVLGTATAFNLPTSGAATVIPVTFQPKVPVQAGVTYALVITDIAKRGFAFPTRSTGDCAGGFAVDTFATNAFGLSNSSLIITINP
ncbi:MAG: hypothetical protein QM692_16525 [Thermomicrobiales bacterium]